MAYNYNPKFKNHMESMNKDSKFIKQYRANHDFNYKPSTLKMKNFLNVDAEDEPRYKLMDIDNPNGWSFNEIDTLGHMGFKMDNDYELTCEVEVPSLQMENEKQIIKVYKEEDGYVLETTRRYVFESFNKLIEFIDNVPTKIF